MSGQNRNGSGMLQQLGLFRNPFTDRTAEKTDMDPSSFYLHSDLQGFSPSATTYVFFGKRGSGKTTIRLMMMDKYSQYNSKAIESPSISIPKQLPFLVVDLFSPSWLHRCLTAFKNNVEADNDTWDNKFSEKWTSNDLADTILGSCVVQLVKLIQNVHNLTPGEQNLRDRVISNLRNNRKSATQFLILTYLFAQEDKRSLQTIHDKIFLPNPTAKIIKATAAVSGVVSGLIGITILFQSKKNSSEVSESSWLGSNSHWTTQNLNPGPAAFLGLLCTGLSGFVVWRSAQKIKSLKQRAKDLAKSVRVSDAHTSKVKIQLLAQLLNKTCSVNDSVESISKIYLGENAQRKLELAEILVKNLSYGGMAVFGDCFDEVGLLDPLLYPTALKSFANQVCKNEILNQGRLHFFFPDSRSALDLNTERVVRIARFDRHFVRDLDWSRFQLLELAEKRYIAAMKDFRARREADGEEVFADGKEGFAGLFETVSEADFSAAVSALNTPRELMVFMTELFARMEAHSETNSKVTAQDMEIAVTKAQAQSV